MALRRQHLVQKRAGLRMQSCPPTLFTQISYSLNRVCASLFVGSGGGAIPVPYKDDLIGDYFSDSSTWNDEGTKNIPSIFNGVETNGAETVDVDNEYRYMVGNGANDQLTLGSNIVIGQNRDFVIEYMYVYKDSYGYNRPNLLEMSSNSCAVKIDRGFTWNFYRADGTKVLGLALAYPDDVEVENQEYKVRITNVAGASTCLVERWKANGTGYVSDTGTWSYSDDITANRVFALTQNYENDYRYFKISGYNKCDIRMDTSGSVSDLLGNFNVTNSGMSVGDTYAETTSFNTFALVSQRLVAKGNTGDSASGLANKDAGLRHLGTRDALVGGWFIFNNTEASGVQGMIGSGYYGNAVRNVLVFYNGSIIGILNLVYNGVNVLFQVDSTCAALGITNDVPVFLEFKCDRDTEISLWVNGVKKVSQTRDRTNTYSVAETKDVDVMLTNGFRIATYGTIADHNMAPFNGKVWGAEVRYGGVTVAKYPLEGSCDDTSGNGYHLVNQGVDLFAVANNYIDGLDSHNLRKGFGVGAEEMVDGDMEESGIGGWKKTSAVSKDSTTSHSGSQSLKILAGGRTFNRPMVPGRAYMLSGWYKSAGDAFLKIYITNGGAVYIYNGTVSSDWKYFRLYFTAIVSNTRLVFESGGTSGNIWLDDVSLKEAYAPRLDDLSGYTRTVSEEHPALVKGLNGADVVITMPQELACFDRSNITYFNSLAASGPTYDSSNPSGWHFEDFTEENFSAWSNDGYDHRRYLKEDNNPVVMEGGNIVFDGDDVVYDRLDKNRKGKSLARLLQGDGQRGRTVKDS